MQVKRYFLSIKRALDNDIFCKIILVFKKCLRIDLGRANFNQKLSATPALTLKFCSVIFLARYYVKNVRLEQFLFISVI